MQKTAFGQVGRMAGRGLRRLAAPCRRMLRRILRPILHRLVLVLALRKVLNDQDHMPEAFKDLPERLARMDDRMQAILYFGWDYVALVRRLAALESQVQALRQTEADAEPAHEPPASLAFRSLRAQELKAGTLRHAHEPEPATAATESRDKAA